MSVHSPCSLAATAYAAQGPCTRALSPTQIFILHHPIQHTGYWILDTARISRYVYVHAPVRSASGLL